LYCVVFQRKFEAKKSAVVLFNSVLKKPAYDAVLNNTQQLQDFVLKAALIFMSRNTPNYNSC